jgi:uroporphyrinogen III methyltransferase/synthase
MSKTGTVYLIGAGPGDKGLITIKGGDLLRSADVIVYDYLVNTALLRYVKENAEIIYVGKKAGQKEMSQQSINALLVRESKKGNTVARLKGGDPFIFGRGAEEAEYLHEKKVPFEIVPGVTSVSAVPAYAGIPLTHRDFTSSFAVVTGHENPSKEKSNIPWEALSQMGTIVFLMGVKNLKKNMSELMGAGKSSDTPVAVTTWGTYPEQTTLTGKIGNISNLLKKRKDITSPAIVVVGEVVNLRKVMNWYESAPLFGKTVLVTRPKGQSRDFIKFLEDKGGQVISFPTIEIVHPKSFQALDDAINNVRSYDWIIFTSVNGVAAFFKRLRELGKDIRELYGAKIAAIGDITSQAIEDMGINVDLVPEDFRAEGLIQKFKKQDINKETKILLPRAKVARDILPKALREMGAHVNVVIAYISKKPDKRKTNIIRKLLNQSKIDLLTFTSSSTARNFFELVPDFKQHKNKPVIACIGPITAKTVREFGFKPLIVPKQYTVEALADEIMEYFSHPNSL